MRIRAMVSVLLLMMVVIARNNVIQESIMPIIITLYLNMVLADSFSMLKDIVGIMEE